MRLPEELSTALEEEIANSDPRELTRAVAELSGNYRSGEAVPLATAARRAAYLAVRLPATYAANLRVLGEVRRLASQVEVHSLLDLGAGPGTAALAAAEVFPSLDSATLVETDTGLITIGRRLAARSRHAAARKMTWTTGNLLAGVSQQRHDLVVLSYSLGEVAAGAIARLLEGAWNSAAEFLAIVEPGTPRGFGVIHQARAALIEAGAHLLAPCPHGRECPMAAAGDWCHFAARLERTSLHRRLKGGALGYEDEKFSYVVASRRPFSPVDARIVRHPQKHPGHVQLLLCGQNGLEKQTIGKSKKELYKQARKAEWGEGWEPKIGRSGDREIG